MTEHPFIALIGRNAELTEREAAHARRVAALAACKQENPNE